MKLTKEDHARAKPIAELVLSELQCYKGMSSTICSTLCYLFDKHYLTNAHVNFFDGMMNNYYSTGVIWFPKDKLGYAKRRKFLEAVINNDDIKVFEHESGYCDIRVIKSKTWRNLWGVFNTKA